MANAEISALMEMLAARPQPEPDAPPPTIEEQRAGFDGMGDLMPPPEGTTHEDFKIGDMDARLVSAEGAGKQRTMLYLHGGGYVIGSIRSHYGLAGRLSEASDASVLQIDYRMAPENPFPAAIDDALSAYRWLLDEGHAAGSIVIAGDSAGGGLTIATLVAIKDAGLATPAAGICMSPWVDLEGLGESMTTKADVDPLVQKDGLLNWAGLYLGDADPRTPLAAPLYADLSGLPPLLIQVGTAETLLDDARRLYEKAVAAGVDTCLEEWDDMIHIWHFFAPMLSDGRKAISRIAEFASEHWD